MFHFILFEMNQMNNFEMENGNFDFIQFIIHNGISYYELTKELLLS